MKGLPFSLYGYHAPRGHALPAALSVKMMENRIQNKDISWKQISFYVSLMKLRNKKWLLSLCMCNSYYCMFGANMWTYNSWVAWFIDFNNDALFCIEHLAFANVFLLQLILIIIMWDRLRDKAIIPALKIWKLEYSSKKWDWERSPNCLTSVSTSENLKKFHYFFLRGFGNWRTTTSLRSTSLLSEKFYFLSVPCWMDVLDHVSKQEELQSQG